MSIDDLKPGVRCRWTNGKHVGGLIEIVKVMATKLEYKVPGRAHGKSAMHRHQLPIDFILSCTELAA